MLPVATAVQHGAPKLNACVLCVRVLGHLFEVFLVLAKTRFIRRVSAKSRLIFDEMCRSFGKLASYLRRVLCKTRLICPCMNSPNDDDDDDYGIDEYGKNGLHGDKEGEKYSDNDNHHHHTKLYFI